MLFRPRQDPKVSARQGSRRLGLRATTTRVPLKNTIRVPLKNTIRVPLTGRGLGIQGASGFGVEGSGLRVKWLRPAGLGFRV